MLIEFSDSFLQFLFFCHVYKNAIEIRFPVFYEKLCFCRYPLDGPIFTDYTIFQMNGLIVLLRVLQHLFYIWKVFRMDKRPHLVAVRCKFLSAAAEEFVKSIVSVNDKQFCVGTTAKNCAGNIIVEMQYLVLCLFLCCNIYTH